MTGMPIPAAWPEPFDDRPVLVSAPLRLGYDRAQLSRYGDAVWDLSPAVFRENARRCHVIVRFDGIAEPALATTLKAYLYARLNFTVPGLRARLAPTVVRASFNKARRFLTFVIAETGALNLKLVDQPLLEAYLAHLRSDPGRTAIQIAALLDVIIDLHLQADLLPNGGICFAPWRGRTTWAVVGVPRQGLENVTPRIPEPVIASLLAWSLKYVTVFAPDILAGRAELTELQTRRAAMMAEDAKLTRQERLFRQRARLEAYLDRRRREGRGMPVWSKPQNGVPRYRDPETDHPPLWWLFRRWGGRPAAALMCQGAGCEN